MKTPKCKKERIPKFKEGDIVQLASDGPKMTIDKINYTFPTDEFEGLYSCKWFAGKKLEDATFNETSLIAWEQPEKNT